MKAILIWFLCSVIAVVCSVLGAEKEASRIQTSCESDTEATVINGQTYLCLSQRQLELMKQQARHGSDSA